MNVIKALPSKTQSANELADIYWHAGVNATVRVWSTNITIEVEDGDFETAKWLAVNGGWKIQ